MSFQKFQTPIRSQHNNVNITQEEKEHGKEITDYLTNCSTQHQRIVYLYKRGWSAKRIASVLLTQKGTQTPVQHVNQVIAKHKKE